MWKRSSACDVGARRATRAALITLRRCGARLGAERGALVAVQLQHRQPDRLGRARDLVERRVDEHADELDAGGAARRRSAAASRSAQRRGEPGQKIIPIAQAPSSTASSAS